MNKITDPGVYDLPVDTYHADPVEGGSLSSTGARRLLPPSCPALFRHEQLHGREPKRVWDLGHAAHRMVLGAGPPIAVIDAPDYKTKAARETRDEAREAGAVPLLTHEYQLAGDMAGALRRHPVASALLDPDRGGRPEQTLVWRDGPTGTWCRSLLDWLPPLAPAGRLIVPDYKTCAAADPDSLERAAYQHGWHQQAAWYLAGLRALGLADEDAAFVFVAQEKTEPYLVTVVELDHVALRIGHARNRRALGIYQHCTSTGEWPGYVDGVHLLSLPRWAEIEEGEAT